MPLFSYQHKGNGKTLSLEQPIVVQVLKYTFPDQIKDESTEAEIRAKFQELKPVDFRNFADAVADDQTRQQIEQWLEPLPDPVKENKKKKRSSDPLLGERAVVLSSLDKLKKRYRFRGIHTGIKSLEEAKAIFPETPRKRPEFSAQQAGSSGQIPRTQFGSVPASTPVVEGGGSESPQFRFSSNLISFIPTVTAQGINGASHPQTNSRAQLLPTPTYHTGGRILRQNRQTL